MPSNWFTKACVVAQLQLVSIRSAQLLQDEADMTVFIEMSKTSPCVCVDGHLQLVDPASSISVFVVSPRTCRKRDLFSPPLCQRSDVELFVVLPFAPLT